MKNFIAQGETLEITTTAAHDSGDVVIVEDVAGIAAGDAESGETAVLAMQGVYEVPKASGAVAQGELVYWDPDGTPYGGASGVGAATTTADTNIKMGFAYAAAGSTAATVQVKLTN